MRQRRWKPDSKGLLSAAAAITAAAARTTFPVAGVVAAVVSGTRTEAIEDWRHRLVAKITEWARVNCGRWAVVADLPSGFADDLLAVLDDRAVGELDPGDPRLRALLVEALMASVFVPLTNLPEAWSDAKAAAEALVEALPELLVRSAPDDTPLAPLRNLIGKDIDQVTEELVRLGGEIGVLRTELATGAGGSWRWRGGGSRTSGGPRKAPSPRAR